MSGLSRRISRARVLSQISAGRSAGLDEDGQRRRPLPSGESISGLTAAPMLRVEPVETRSGREP